MTPNELRVYIVECISHGLYDPRNCGIEEFADYAERQGIVCTLSYLLGLLNDYDDTPPAGIPNFKNCVVRAAIVRDGKIIEEIEEEI